MREWFAFCAAALFWGSSFFWIKIALRDIGPFAVVGFRLFFAALGMSVVLALSKKRLPRDKRTIRDLFVMAMLSPCVPFLLISWSQTRIDSSLAAILNGTVPLFTLLMAHVFLEDEKISPRRAAGLLLGFCGVMVLVSRDFSFEKLRGGFAGQLAVIAGSISYAYSVIWSRKRLRDMAPVVQSASLLMTAFFVVCFAVPVLETGRLWPSHWQTWFATAWLGLLGSAAGFLCFFYLLNRWGPTRATLVNYVWPLVGFALGVVFLGEKLDARLVAGALCIIAGVLLVSTDALKRVRRGTVASL